jgi:hypothetical protein
MRKAPPGMRAVVGVGGVIVAAIVACSCAAAIV